jgi:hypothetical protein
VPAVPHYPSDEPREDDRQSIDDIVDRILNGDESSPTASVA